MSTDQPTSVAFQKTMLYRRWSIDRTLKEGWRPKDMSISATYEEGNEPDESLMRDQARHCHNEAQTACDELNDAAKQTERFTSTKEI